MRILDPAAEVPEGLRATGPGELLSAGGIVVPAVPMRRFRAVLEEIRPHCTKAHTVVDVASVKRGAVEAMGELLGDEVPWVATHPLFGPMSIGLGERPLRVVVCPDTPHEAAVVTARRFYERRGFEAYDHGRSPPPEDEPDVWYRWPAADRGAASN